MILSRPVTIQPRESCLYAENQSRSLSYLADTLKVLSVQQIPRLEHVLSSVGHISTVDTTVRLNAAGVGPGMATASATASAAQCSIAGMSALRSATSGSHAHRARYRASRVVNMDPATNHAAAYANPAAKLFVNRFAHINQLQTPHVAYLANYQPAISHVIRCCPVDLISALACVLNTASLLASNAFREFRLSEHHIFSFDAGIVSPPKNSMLHSSCINSSS